MDIADPDILHSVESELLESAFHAVLEEMDASTRFNEAFFKGLHRKPFIALYDWAGEYRQYEQKRLAILLLPSHSNSGNFMVCPFRGR